MLPPHGVWLTEAMCIYLECNCNGDKFSPVVLGLLLCGGYMKDGHEQFVDLYGSYLLLVYL